MQYKFTNFYINKKTNFLLFNLILFFLNFNISLATPSYKMSVENINIVNINKVEASVYIENVGNEELVITSYQCALSINQSLDLSSLTLTYKEGSSELLNEPNLYVGIDDIDGVTELAFVSYVGNDLITKKTRVGTFVLEGNLNIVDISTLNIQWNFEGTVSTIITGINFENITNPANHESVFGNEQKELIIGKVPVISSEASAITDDKFTNTKLFDGITSSTSSSKSSSADGRWAVAGFPQWVTMDLGEETYLEKIKIDGYGSEDGISYDCEFYSGTYDQRVLISKATTSTGTQWSEHNLGGVRARYLTVVITGSKGNTWCDFWEVEIYGSNSTTDVEEEDDVVFEEETLPTEYGISQNYPNPFNPTTKVQVMMKEQGKARIDIYNLLGERVLAVLDEDLSAGIHEININGSSLPSGVYFYRLVINDNFSQTKKMNLLK